jgi:signal transduction histidine kinase
MRSGKLFSKLYLPSEISRVSHYIFRTPLNGIVGMIDMISETKLTSNQLDFISTIRTSASVLLQIVNNILDLYPYLPPTS